ncbi:DNA adenine methylase [Dyadobacter sp. 32]|uniref:DNA adenine methylase n=1 Tax=Dyadobacter sp. 32 TaxID=538966 RepID=UPI0011F098D7
MLPGNKVFQTYFGGKNGSGVYQQIINVIRPHHVYMELFAGSGAVFQNKKPSATNIINDIDPMVYERWKASSIDNIVLLNTDAIRFLESYEFNPDLKYCIYLDPPYPLSSRRSSIDVYNYEISDHQHIQLLNVVKQLESMANIDIIVSTYKNEMYAEHLKDWQLLTFQAKTRVGLATEYLYMNYRNDEGILHDYGFLGNTFTDRQRIKRKIEREIQKLKNLDPHERNAIIFSIIEEYQLQHR